jgi:hypothetical protein
MADRISFALEIATASAVQSLVQLSKELGKTELSADDVAKALRQAADDAEEEIRKISAASSSMETALGADFVAAAAQAGTSVDDIVVQLHSLGVSFDDIEANADELAAAVKRLDDVQRPVRALGDEASTTAGQIDKVRDSGDQSGSVLANMVGNSVQEVGELGGVAGTAGMALGQLAEYATEGNISLAGLAKVAGPMAGVTAAVLGVSWAVGKQGVHRRWTLEAAKPRSAHHPRPPGNGHRQATARPASARRGRVRQSSGRGNKLRSACPSSWARSSVIDRSQPCLGSFGSSTRKRGPGRRSMSALHPPRSSSNAIETSGRCSTCAHGSDRSSGTCWPSQSTNARSFTIDRALPP